jgi:eukaryotic-like serine/threonine-protein kinase
MDVPARYRFITDLAPGGMSTVARYHDDQLDRDVVIKCVAPGNFYRRVMDEIRALERIRSDYVVDVYDILIDGETREIGIIQAYLEGHDLAEFDVGILSERTRLEILYQLADALSEIHRAGIIHRDVKPQNMRILANNRLVLFDFGLAREAATGNQTTGFVGTIAYAAPELFGDGFVQFTSAIDIYALGAVAHFLVHGRGLPPLQVRLQQPFLFQAGDFAAPSIVDMLNDCLRVDPSSRPDAQSVRDKLRSELLRNRHRALLIGAGQRRTIDCDNRTATLRAPNVGEVQVQYDGYEFIITAVDGPVYMNNKRLAQGMRLTGCCVLSFGTSGPFRTYATFDVSNPEVLIQ